MLVVMMINVRAKYNVITFFFHFSFSNLRKKKILVLIAMSNIESNCTIKHNNVIVVSTKYLCINGV